MWYDEAVFYQIYPLGFVGAPAVNDGVLEHRILKVVDWVNHIKEIGANAIYLSPVFESDAHGYDTRDYRKIDCRLGTNEDFANVIKICHKNSVRVIIDGVFNHVGRGSKEFQDVLANRENSRYKDWFNINFYGNNDYNDGLWYEGWEGHYNLVKLNLRNPEVRDYLYDTVRYWVSEFDIDGLRLDVAYMLDNDFLHGLRDLANVIKPEFFLLGEMLHGDYNQKMNDGMLHSVTNYECYKGLYSSFNSMNMFEIAHSINRQFGNEQWCLYRGKHLLNFVDNHDVNRIASQLSNIKHLPLIYGLLFAMPGIPQVYYGSEWGATGVKENGSDAGLRACFDNIEENDLSNLIAKLAKAHKESKALCYGNYTMKHLTNKQYIFERYCVGERILVAINADENNYMAYFDAGCQYATDLIDGSVHDFSGGSELAPYSIKYWKCER